MLDSSSTCIQLQDMQVTCEAIASSVRHTSKGRYVCLPVLTQWAWQAIGATTPFFTAVLGLIMLRDRETWLVYGSLIPVVVGAQPCACLAAPALWNRRVVPHFGVALSLPVPPLCHSLEQTKCQRKNQPCHTGRSSWVSTHSLWPMLALCLFARIFVCTHLQVHEGHVIEAVEA